MDTFGIIFGGSVACIGFWLIFTGALASRSGAVTPRDIEKWRMRAGKQSFNAPWNLPFDVMSAFVRAWRRQDAARRIGMGIGIFTFGVVVAIANELALTRLGSLIFEALYQFLGVVFYSSALIAAYLGIVSLSRRQSMNDQPDNRRPLRDFRHPVVPALGIALLLVYAALLVVVIARLTHGFDVTSLAQVMAWPEVWGLLFGLLVMLAAIVITEVVVRRIVALPAIAFPPATGWERLARYVLRFQAISDCYVATLLAIIVTAVSASFLVDIGPVNQSAMSGWYQFYFVLVGLAGLAFGLLILFHVPSPPRASFDAIPGASAQPQQ